MTFSLTENANDDLIDIREVIARVEALRETADSAGTPELERLEALLCELSGCGGDHEWEGAWYPVTLIRAGHFEQYAEDTAGDIYGKQVTEAKWPFNCIDWEQAANQLLIDYQSVDLKDLDDEAETYYYR